MFNQEEINQALDYLSTNFPDSKVNSNKKAGGTPERPDEICNISYKRVGMKSSEFKHLHYNTCLFENVAFTGSLFRSVAFKKTKLTGNSFAFCDFYDVEVDGLNCDPFCANNFSLSSFEKCRFSNLRFVSSGMLNSLFHNSNFSDVVFQSSTLEGTSFINCRLKDCDLSAVNLEFTHFSRTDLDSVRFPFYQFPYVIGAADYIADKGNAVMLCVNGRTLSVENYKNQLDNLILYFYDKRDFFPICNLYIAKGCEQEARIALLDGISYALSNHDFRMIQYFCQLALHHDILDDFTRYRIIRDLDNFLQTENIPETRLNEYMSHVGRIRTLLHSGSSNSVALQFNIKTNVSRNDADGIKYVNGLIGDLNQVLAESDGQKGFKVMVANYSPYEIAVEVLSAVGSAASIASFIWMTIDAAQKAHTRKKYTEVDPEMYRAYISTRIEYLRANLLQLQKQYSRKKFNKYIDEVTQQLKTDLEELYTKDILIFKVKNQNSKEKE